MASDARKLDRKHVLLNAIIISPEGAQAARISDLSPSGVQVTCEHPPSLDCDVIFKRGEVFAAARVAWSNETGAGLQFYRELDPSEVGNRPVNPH